MRLAPRRTEYGFARAAVTSGSFSRQTPVSSAAPRGVCRAIRTNVIMAKVHSGKDLARCMHIYIYIYVVFGQVWYLYVSMLCKNYTSIYPHISQLPLSSGTASAWTSHLLLQSHQPQPRRWCRHPFPTISCTHCIYIYIYKYRYMYIISPLHAHPYI